MSSCACSAVETAPDQLLERCTHLFLDADLPGPIIDLACGDCHNGIYLAKYHLPVWCCDLSAEALQRAAQLAEREGAVVRTWQKDLEMGIDPLPEDFFGGILVFRYLHRPLMANIRTALREGGILIYETYTRAQEKFGKPSNPNHLLEEGQLYDFFKDWRIFHYCEGMADNPPRAIAQLVCQKPAAG